MNLYIIVYYLYMCVISCVCLFVCACMDLHMWVSVRVAVDMCMLAHTFYEYEIRT